MMEDTGDNRTPCRFLQTQEAFQLCMLREEVAALRKVIEAAEHRRSSSSIPRNATDDDAARRR